MKKLLLVALLIGAVVTVQAQDQFQKEAMGTMTFTKGRIEQLANAMPDDKFSWSPSEGVRSYAGVIGHVVSANYFFGMKIGGTPPPEGVDPMTIEKTLKTKAELVKALNSSFEFLSTAMNNLKSDDLSTKVEMPFPGEYTKMSLVNIAMNHMSEHMGQMIAYARSNEVTPPWSKPAGDQ